LITGVAGFIGSHAASALLARGATVIGVDNLSRPGAAHTLSWLRSQPGDFQFVPADLRQQAAMQRLLAARPRPDAVLHLAAQVAVTTSVAHPRLDFEINAQGTLHLLEAVRRHAPGAAFLYASTNKVYGAMPDARVTLQDGRYAYQDHPRGIDETAPLDFHSPYGCSKGAADQYVHDYARIYGLKSVVFRQSCIYGTRQFGVEDQGWVAWFTIASVLGRPITLYGDGRQARDLLWVDDLVDLYLRAIAQIDRAAGQVYNVGGGPAHTMSLRKLLALLSALTGREIPTTMAAWRPGDQRVYVSDIGKVERHLGWRPRIAPREGVQRLHAWACHSRELLAQVLSEPAPGLPRPIRWRRAARRRVLVP
jgi:CDP-paratose 2-epimerase